MNLQNFMSNRLLALATAVIFSAGLTTANADEPCPPDGEFGECKVLVEINTTDGDIGFHFLMDGDDLILAKLLNPEGEKIFKYVTRGELREQFLTETFAESAEPLCWPDPEALEEAEEEGEELEIVTLEDFLELWSEGTYTFIGFGEDWEMSFGETELTFDLPAAPKNLSFELDMDDDSDDDSDSDSDSDGDGEISWERGDDLGNCATKAELAVLVADGDLPTHPEDVTVAAWEVVFEPDVEDGDIVGSFKYVVRIAGDVEELEVTVPADYLETLPDDTLVKIEIGAIGEGDNATFTEIFDICINVDEGCEDD